MMVLKGMNLISEWFKKNSFILVSLLIIGIFTIGIVVGETNNNTTNNTTGTIGETNTESGTSWPFSLDFNQLLIFLIIIILVIIIIISGWYLGLFNEIIGKGSSGHNYHSLQIKLVDALSKKSVPHIKISIKRTYGEFYSNEGITDTTGTKKFYNLPKGTYELKISGDGKYESVSKEIEVKNNVSKTLELKRLNSVKIQIIDEETNQPIEGIQVRVKEKESNIDINGGSKETNENGVVTFKISSGKEYVISAKSRSGEYIESGNIPLTNKDKIIIKLTKKTGTLEVTVAEENGETYADILVVVINRKTGQSIDLKTDSNGKISKKIPIGDYTVRLKKSEIPLYESVEQKVTIEQDKTTEITLNFKFNYKPQPDVIIKANSIIQDLNASYNEVSVYDAGIPLFFKSVGFKPIELVDRIIKKPVEFLGTNKNPDEIISYLLDTAESISSSISNIMKDKSNVDYYFSIQNLAPIENLVLSDYSIDKFSELVNDTENYYNNHLKEISNKLMIIDNEITQLSVDLTVQPVADLWKIAQKLLTDSNNESNPKKKGVMLFVNDKLLDHVREMYTIKEIKERLKFSML